MSPAADPKEITLAAHSGYYSQGGYDDNRLSWTVSSFLSGQRFERALEVGCGDGAMLQLLQSVSSSVTGVDASSSGIERCKSRGVDAQCLDISTQGLPFPDNSFDLVVSLETFEHLMNPHYALQEVKRTLKPDGKFLCSVPNPLTGHPYLYPGLFEYKNFRAFLEQSGFVIGRVDHWEWVAREMFLPATLRRVPFVNSRPVAGGLRKIVEKAYLAAGSFPYFCYWLWTFDCRNQKSDDADVFHRVSEQTRPGSPTHFGSST